MAIRLRVVDGKHIVVCAACTIEKPGDVYLGDEWHGPLSDKFARDFNEMYAHGLPFDEDGTRLVEQEESNNPARDWWDKTYGDEGRKKPAGHNLVSARVAPCGCKIEDRKFIRSKTCRLYPQKGTHR